MKDHDFEATINWLFHVFRVEDMPKEHEIHTALFALKLAKKITETSESMIDIGESTNRQLEEFARNHQIETGIDIRITNDLIRTENTFRAMINQAVKEIE